MQTYWMRPPSAWWVGVCDLLAALTAINLASSCTTAYRFVLWPLVGLFLYFAGRHFLKAWEKRVRA